MRHSFIDRYSRLSSPIHRIPIPVKLLATVALLVTVVVLPISVSLFFAVATFILIVIGLLSQIPLAFLVKRLLFLELFVVGVAGLSLLQVNGVVVFLTLFVKSTMCLFTILLFSNTTPFGELLRSLKRWRFPDLLITILALMYRYLFVMIDEMERMQRARISRTFVRRRRFALDSLAAVVAQLFIRSTERAERIYAAMCARGWK